MVPCYDDYYAVVESAIESDVAADNYKLMDNKYRQDNTLR